MSGIRGAGTSTLNNMADATITNPQDGQQLVYSSGEWINTVPAGGGDVVGPAGATDRAIAIYNAATGKVIQNSLATIDASGTIEIPAGETYKIDGNDILPTPLITDVGFFLKATAAGTSAWTDTSDIVTIPIGIQTVDGSWRITISGADLLIEKRVAGNWVTKSTIAGA